MMGVRLGGRLWSSGATLILLKVLDFGTESWCDFFLCVFMGANLFFMLVVVVDDSDSALHTQLWIDPAEEFLQYTHVGDAVDVTFGVKELKVKHPFHAGDFKVDVQMEKMGLECKNREEVEWSRKGLKFPKWG